MTHAIISRLEAENRFDPTPGEPAEIKRSHRRLDDEARK